MRFFILFLCFLTSARSEYRVYQYYVTYNSPTKKDLKPYIVTSALNPVSFQSYHGGSSTSIDLLRTWMCPGHTGNKEYCPSPYKKLTDKLAEISEQAAKGPL